MFAISDTWMWQYGKSHYRDWDGRFLSLEADKEMNLRTKTLPGTVAAYAFAIVLNGNPWFDGDQVQTALHQAIAKLPPKQKAVFLLRYFEEMPYEKIAQVLETSEGALKASYHHAYEKVKAWMKESLEAKY